jgi:hypothetical protein
VKNPNGQSISYVATFAAAAEEPPHKKEGFFAKLKEKVTFHHHPKPAEDEAVAV